MDTPWQRLSKLLFKYRIRLSFFVFGLLVIWEFYRGVSLRAVFSPADPVGLVASLLVVAGALLRSWSAGVIQKNDRLATGGPYALFRHPLYMGSLWIAVGVLVLINEPLNYAVLLLIILLVYVPKIRAEERKLSAEFGEEWAAFAARTGVFCPKGVPASLRTPWSLGQWRHNREYNAFLASLAVLVLLAWLHSLG